MAQVRVATVSGSRPATRSEKRSEEQVGSRSPKLLIMPRTQLMSCVLAETRAWRARIKHRSDCADVFRCWIGESKEGSTLAKRARVLASTLSVFFELS